MVDLIAGILMPVFLLLQLICVGILNAIASCFHYLFAKNESAEIESDESAEQKSLLPYPTNRQRIGGKCLPVRC
jgi:flagellar motility protein MotE (MotC chaperone)